MCIAPFGTGREEIMATHIQGVSPTPALARDGKAKNTNSGQQRRSERSGSREVAADKAHSVELSPESISKAQKIVTGSGYITSSDFTDIDFTDEDALALADAISNRLKETAGSLIQPPSNELAGMVG